MAIFLATMRVVHHETWEVEAEDEADVREKIQNLHPDVVTDDSCGETVDWTVMRLKMDRSAP